MIRSQPGVDPNYMSSSFSVSRESMRASSWLRCNNLLLDLDFLGFLLANAFANAFAIRIILRSSSISIVFLVGWSSTSLLRCSRTVDSGLTISLALLAQSQFTKDCIEVPQPAAKLIILRTSNRKRSSLHSSFVFVACLDGDLIEICVFHLGGRVFEDCEKEFDLSFIEGIVGGHICGDDWWLTR